MDVIANIVRNMVLIVLLAVFLQMLIPEGRMSRYVNFIMGLFILIAILGPILPYITGETTIEIDAWQYFPSTSENTAAVMEDGRRLQEKNNALALEQYRKNLASQMETLAALVDGVATAKAEVLLEESEKEQELGMIKMVNMAIATKNQNEESDEISIPVVKIAGERQKGNDADDKLQIIWEVERGLMTVYNLAPAQINIVLDGNEEE